MNIAEIKINGMTVDDFTRMVFKCKEFVDELYSMMRDGTLDSDTSTSIVAATCVSSMIFQMAQNNLAGYARDILEKKIKTQSEVSPGPMGIPVTPSDKQS